MADILLLQEIADRALRMERMFQDHIDLFAESDEFLFGRFRLPRAVLVDLCNDLDSALRSHTHRSNPLPPHVQVLSTLDFLATGSFQRELGDRVGISQPSISRTLPRVVDAIIQRATHYIRFPYAVEEQVPVKTGFHNIAGLPNTIGAIDCTHVRIKAPSPDHFPYLNSKQYHSINVQLVCDSNNHLLNVVSRFPGGAHDSYILQKSSVGMHLEQGAAGDAWLIGRLRIFYIYLFTTNVSLILICFIRGSRICPSPMVNDATDQPSDTSGGVLQSDARTHSLHHRTHHWHFKGTLDVFGHSRWQIALQTGKGKNRFNFILVETA